MRIIYLPFSLIFCCFLTSHLSAQVTFENAFPNLSFSSPLEIQNTGVPGDDRLFVVEQRGTIKVFENDASTSSTTDFLDIENEVFFGFGQELGLLGLAFHPNYQQNGYFYIYYTKRVGSSNAIITVERIRVDTNDPNSADLNNRLVLFEFTKNQTNSNHNGGKITFGPDGYLYVSIGDGGGANDPSNNARNVDRFFGKILRIDVDVDGNNPVDNNGVLPDGNYEIPSDNPLVGQNGQDEIYAWGIRNTWKMNFDQVTGRLWAGDVGQGDLEEINLIENGGNYGWDRFEGTSVEDASVPDPGNTIFPVLEYDHDAGDVSITGGYVYRGNEISSLSPSLFGKYIFGDYSSGRVWAMDYDPSTGNASREFLFRANGVNISSFGEDINNEIYFTEYNIFGGSNIYKIVDGVSSPQAQAVSGFGDWCNSIPATNGTINAAIGDANDRLYIGGAFSEVDGLSANNIAVWDGNSWSTLGSGANGDVNALAFDDNGDLYAGGAFTSIGGVAANNIAKWNGTAWQALGNGTSGPVAALGVDSNNKVYVGGAFVTAGSITCNNVAVWDGTWSAMTDAGNAIAGTNNEIRSIDIDGNDLVYVGGNFASAGGNTASRIATWDGSNWGTLGDGTTGFVQAILNTTDYLYAGGNFGGAGSLNANRVARWNKSSQTWETLEDGLSNVVNDLVSYNGFIYAAGSFPIALGAAPDPNIIVSNIARWSESTGWEALGTSAVGVDNVVNALTLIGDMLYVGGNFESAGGNSAANLACWSEICPRIRQVAGLDLTGSFQSDSLTTNTGTCIIQSQAAFVAGQFIRLQAGFHAQAGSQFTASIGLCGSSSLRVYESQPNDEEQANILAATAADVAFTIFPNPATNMVNFKYQLLESSAIQINLYDLNGRLLTPIFSAQEQAAGDYLVEFPVAEFEGMYWVELVHNGAKISRKLLVMNK